MKLFIRTASLAFVSLFLASASQANVHCVTYDARSNVCLTDSKHVTNGLSAQACAGAGFMEAHACQAKVKQVSDMLAKKAAAQKAHH